MRSVIGALLLSLRTSLRARSTLQLEMLALRHQLQVLDVSRPRRVRLTCGNRLLWVWMSRVWDGWRAAVVIVKPKRSSPGTSRGHSTGRRLAPSLGAARGVAHASPTEGVGPGLVRRSSQPSRPEHTGPAQHAPATRNSYVVLLPVHLTAPSDRQTGSVGARMEFFGRDTYEQINSRPVRTSSGSGGDG